MVKWWSSGKNPPPELDYEAFLQSIDLAQVSRDHDLAQKHGHSVYSDEYLNGARLNRERNGGSTPRPFKSQKLKKCKHCGRPVRETVYNLGYCKRCIKEARDAQAK